MIILAQFDTLGNSACQTLHTHKHTADMHRQGCVIKCRLTSDSHRYITSLSILSLFFCCELPGLWNTSQHTIVSWITWLKLILKFVCLFAPSYRRVFIVSTILEYINIRNTYAIVQWKKNIVTVRESLNDKGAHLICLLRPTELPLSETSL